MATIVLHIGALKAAPGQGVAFTNGEVKLTYAERDAAWIRSARVFIAAGLEKCERIVIWAPNNNK